jgi:hypothetical protein
MSLLPPSSGRWTSCVLMMEAVRTSGTLVNSYQSNGATTQKTAIFVFTAVRTSIHTVRYCVYTILSVDRVWNTRNQVNILTHHSSICLQYMSQLVCRRHVSDTSFYSSLMSSRLPFSIGELLGLLNPAEQFSLVPTSRRRKSHYLKRCHF